MPTDKNEPLGDTILPAIPENSSADHHACICRAGRGLLDWPTSKLARQASVSLAKIMDLERSRMSEPVIYQKVRVAFMEAGVIPIIEQGVEIGVKFTDLDQMKLHVSYKS